MNRFENISAKCAVRKCMKFALLCAVLCMGGFVSCANHQMEQESVSEPKDSDIPDPILPGIYKVDSLATTLAGKTVGVVSNHTGMIGNTHLVDTLLSLGVEVSGVFAPEHGFRGDVPDGAEIDHSKDQKTGLPIYSLYGKTKKPTDEMLQGLDVIVFDIQDVGARFYTYLSTLHYVMEAAAENDISVIVLDRPNPNGFYVDGPVMKSEFTSFVGLHPVPVVYGMTIGEYGQMINGEKWLADGQSCALSVVTCSGYDHNSIYTLPIKPSPNLPDMESIYLYPSLCFFEGTTVSVGRGTDFPFSIMGEPTNESGDFKFTPESRPGASVNPKHKGEECRGYNLRNQVNLNQPKPGLQIAWLCKMYEETADKASFVNSNGYFHKLVGNDELKSQLEKGLTPDQIRESWKEDLQVFEKVRAKYLIYE